MEKPVKKIVLELPFEVVEQLSSKFNRAFEFLHKGIVDYPTADQEFVKIGYAVLQILKGLSSEHLKK